MQKSRLEAIKYKLVNHPVLSVIIAFGIIVMSIASFTDAASRLVALFDSAFTDESINIEATVRSQNIEVRWNGNLKPWHYPLKNENYRNEIRLNLSFKTLAKHEATIDGLRFLMDWHGKEVIWEGAYSAANTPYILQGQIDTQIQKNRTDFTPFQIGGDHQAILFKTIDFIPLNSTKEKTNLAGVYDGLLQIKEISDNGWIDMTHFSFEIPADFKLEGVDKKGVSYSRYNYWQPFPLLKNDPL